MRMHPYRLPDENIRRATLTPTVSETHSFFITSKDMRSACSSGTASTSYSSWRSTPRTAIMRRTASSRCVELPGASLSALHDIFLTAINTSCTSCIPPGLACTAAHMLAARSRAAESTTSPRSLDIMGSHKHSLLPLPKLRFYGQTSACIFVCAKRDVCRFCTLSLFFLLHNGPRPTPAGLRGLVIQRCDERRPGRCHPRLLPRRPFLPIPPCLCTWRCLHLHPCARNGERGSQLAVCP